MTHVSGPDNVFLAERVGFEPTIGYSPIHAFQACAFNRSAISPAAIGANYRCACEHCDRTAHGATSSPEPAAPFPPGNNPSRVAFCTIWMLLLAPSFCLIDD